MDGLAACAAITNVPKQAAAKHNFLTTPSS